MDTLVNLRTFVAVADAGSFSEAARQAGLVPSVIAKRVTQLEERIHAPLFVRSTRKLTLTDVGERYLPELRRLARQLDETLNGMARAAGELEGHIRVKIPSTFGMLHLGELLNRFLHDHPRISMEVVLADRSVNPVEEGFDLAIGARPESYGQVQDLPLCPIPRRLCAAPIYLASAGVPVSPSELAAHDCLVLSTTGTRWELQGPQGSVEVKVRAKLTSNDGVALHSAACAGQGIAVLADYLIGADLMDGTLQEVLPNWSLPTLWLKALVPFSRIELPRIQALVAFLQRELTDALPGCNPVPDPARGHR